MSEATEELMHEHRAIERLIGLLERAADKIEKGTPVPPAILADAVDFMRGFADKCHHAKEEDLLFPAMARRGVPYEAGPLAVMLADHRLGRQYAAGMAAALPGYEKGHLAATATLIENMRGYAQLLRAHIHKEDFVLYPRADQVLDDGEKMQLAKEFARVEKEVTGPGEHEKHLAMLDTLEAAVG